MRKVLIAAVAEDGVIGINGRLPWACAEDLVRFKAQTMGHPLLMGRKTFESMGSLPLPGRHTIVLSRNVTMAHHVMTAARAASAEFRANPFMIWLHDLSVAIDHAECNLRAKRLFVAGGESIYQQALSWVHEVRLTLIPGEAAHKFRGHFTRFPEWPLSKTAWAEVERVPGVAPDLEYVTYQRRGVRIPV